MKPALFVRGCYGLLLVVTIFLVMGSIRFGRQAIIQPDQDNDRQPAVNPTDSAMVRHSLNLIHNSVYSGMEREAQQLTQNYSGTGTDTGAGTGTDTGTGIPSEENSSPVTKLVIVSYTRSGSTFTGDLFNHHPRVFYFYEPLRSLEFHFQRNQPAFFFHKTPLIYNATDPDQVTSLENDVMTSTLGCQFLTMYIRPLMLDWSHNKSLSCKPFADCTDAQPGMLGLMSCLPLLRKVCSSAKVVAVKTTRFSVKQAAILLRDDPKVKVIHLVRDPRGMLRSRRLAGMVEGSPLFTQAADIQALCSSMAENFRDSQFLKKQYPGRILIARYEDLSRWPSEFSSRLLNFAGLALDPKLRQYIWNITSSQGKFSDVMWQTRRSDSRQTAMKWRRDLDFGSVAVIDSLCGELYGYAGYLRLPAKSFQSNLGVATHRNWKQVPALWTS